MIENHGDHACDCGFTAGAAHGDAVAAVENFSKQFRPVKHRDAGVPSRAHIWHCVLDGRGHDHEIRVWRHSGSVLGKEPGPARTEQVECCAAFALVQAAVGSPHCVALSKKHLRNCAHAAAPDAYEKIRAHEFSGPRICVLCTMIHTRRSFLTRTARNDRIFLLSI